MGHELTDDEARTLFLEHMWDLIDFWEQHAPDHTRRALLEGLMHSVLATLDGCAMDLPGYAVIPCPHPDDKAYREAEGSDWYAPQPSDLAGDIAGGLHELFYAIKR
jgi:hypothetical protein